MNATVDRFIAGMVEAMNCDPTVIAHAAVSVSPDPRRAESHVTAGYELGEHLIITCDPAVADLMAGTQDSIGPNLVAWNDYAVAHGGEFLGAARMQVLPSHLLPALSLPAGYSLRSLDRTNLDHVALIGDFMAASSDEDLDDAELDPNDLSQFIEVVVDADGDIASYADAKPWDMVDGFGDIGLLTRPEARGKALGSAAVTSLCQQMFDAGIEPLYRCDETNTASIRLSASLGFEVATMLSGYRFPVDGPPVS